MTGIELNKNGMKKIESKVICIEDSDRAQMRVAVDNKQFGECPLVKPNSSFSQFSWNPAKLNSGKYWISNKIHCVLISILNGDIEVVEK